ncbi:efflux RND transporter periplasmic adaptor subunit [Leucothrix arctica]|nr:hypothetical protein [Leucothrix arctica]
MSSENEQPIASKKKFSLKMLLLPLAIIAAVLIVRGMAQSKKPLEHELRTFPEKLAHVITVESLPFRAQAVGYGSVEPSVNLNYKAEVGGKVTYIHPDLKQGGSIAKGTIVLRIEPTSYEISLGQSKAGLANTQSSLAQLAAEERSARNSLNIAKRNLTLGQQEYGRVNTLWKKRVVARSTLDAEQQKVLQLQASVQDIQGNLDTFTSRRAAINAQISQSKSTIAENTDTLSRTSVTLPFDARIGEVLAEEGAFVSAGSQLFEALGTNAIEVEAQLSIKHAGQLLRGTVSFADNIATAPERLAAMNNINLEATVHLASGAMVSSWPAKLVRIGESVDSTTDTVSFTVQVQNPYQGIVPGKKPPLLKGLYVAVDFKAGAQQRIVIPRKAIHEGRVYLVNTENKLEIRPVKVATTQGNLVVIESGVSVGDRIIVSDLIPVISGVPIKAIEVPEEVAQLRKEASGEVTP